MRILVCGDRNLTDYWLVKSHLEDRDVNSLDEENVIISGGARGADTLAERFANQFAMKVEIYKADWEKYGKAAGHIRNKQMLVEGKPDKVIAFLATGSKGTANMIRQAIEAGIPVEIVPVRLKASPGPLGSP